MYKDTWENYQRTEEDPREDQEDQHHDARRAGEGTPPLPRKLNQESSEKRRLRNWQERCSVSVEHLIVLLLLLRRFSRVRLCAAL